MSASRCVSGGLRLVAISSLAIGAAGARADVLVYTAFLDGPSESPPNNSPGTGSAVVTIDTTAHTMRLEAQFTGLIGTTTASHIHAPTAVPLAGTAGVATQTPTFTGFPLGVTSGTYDHTFNMLDAASYNPSFITANGGTPASAEAALFAAIAQGRAYLNIHSSAFGGGEIRGFLIPGPGAGVALGLGALLAVRRRRTG
jgi:hypothetical protein